MRIRCPKCQSDNIIVGNDKESNKCSDCDHTWPNTDTEESPCDQTAEDFDVALGKALEVI
jgi:Zn finger protein HypA/HybF involved in hydrogenase expression